MGYKQNEDEELNVNGNDAPRPHEANVEEIISDNLSSQHKENDGELNSSNAIIPSWNDDSVTTYNILACTLCYFI